MIKKELKEAFLAYCESQGLRPKYDALPFCANIIKRSRKYNRQPMYHLEIVLPTQCQHGITDYVYPMGGVDGLTLEAMNNFLRDHKNTPPRTCFKVTREGNLGEQR